MKIYTKTGDLGTTSLASGARVSKASLRLEAYGTIDELNAHFGALHDHLSVLNNKNFNETIDLLRTIQFELFSIGSELALAYTNQKPGSLVGPDSIQRLENEIDAMTKILPPLRNFIIPGGHPANSAAHICRTVCRRAERHIVDLKEKELQQHNQQGIVRAELITYLNRLSDWVFTLCRKISYELKTPEVTWKSS